jgi:GxxExxY protein
LLVENLVVIEVKSVELIAPIHKKQLLTYLRLTKKPLGLRASASLRETYP